MGMQNPQVSEPLDKLTDVFPEGTPFYLQGVRTVDVNTAAYGKGKMVILRVRGHERELGVWGAYLLAQAEAVEADDLNQWYTVERRPVDGFGKGGRPVKAFTPSSGPAPSQVPLEAAQATVQPTDDDDDIPF